MDLAPTYDANQIHNQGYGPVSFGDDSRLFVKFTKKSVQNALKSKEAGRPVFEAVVFVHIQQPGERDYIEKPATDEHVYRFPRQWAAYQRGEEAVPEGTPTSILFPQNPEVVDMLKFSKVYTVEQLASCNDTQLQNLGLGGRTFMEKARQYLASADKGKGFHELSSRLDQMEMQIKAKDDRIAALEAALAEAGEELPDQPKRRGRPPKAVAA